MVRFIKSLAVLCLAVALPVSGMAQSSFSAAYRVNQSIVSYYDIDQRTKLMRALGANNPNLRQVATDTLIDERIQVEHARNFGVTLSPDELERAIDSYAQQRNLTGERLIARLRGSGVSKEALEDFITAGYMWRALLRSRYSQQATPTENELNAQLNTVAVSTASSVQLGEIALLYAERGQDATVALANQLVGQLRNGASFQEAAREYSRSRSAENGGVIGWVSPSRLPAQLAAAVRGLGRGQVAEPIFVPSGIIIIKVLDTRTQSTQIQIPTKINVSYAQLVIPHAEGDQANALQQADRIRRRLDGCRGLNDQIAQLGSGSGYVQAVPINDVPADLALTLARLEPRDSAIMTGSNTVSVVILCDRVSEMTLESREILRNQLFSQNLNNLAEGYMLQLRRTSIIEKQ